MSIDSIKLLAIDVDGTMTDGQFYVNETGIIFKNFHTRDMYAINRATKDGFKVIFVTGSSDRVIYAKVSKSYPVISRASDKFAELSKYIVEQGLSWEDVAYIGDAENDYKCIIEATFSACPSDAIPEILEHSVYSAHYKGGEGAVYDIIRYLYRLRKMEWPMENL